MQLEDHEQREAVPRHPVVERLEGHALPGEREHRRADGEVDGQPVSSTRIRELITTGDVAGAAKLLGGPFILEGPVVHGEKRGRELGYPTANIVPREGLVAPANGVYAGWVHDAHGGVWPAAISIGSNPTFEDVSRVVEAHVIDRHDERVEDFDLYGQHIEVEFVARLRGMVAYEGVEKLVAQITQDVDEARAILATTPSDR